MKQPIMRGDIYYAYLKRGIGSEQRGNRPVLVIQNNVGNWFSPTVIVAALTGKINGKNPLPTHYVLNSLNHLEMLFMVLAEQIVTIYKNRLIKYIGNIGVSEMEKVDKVLAISIGLAFI